MLIRVEPVAVREVCMMGRFFVVPGFVMRRSFMVVMGRVLMMLRCLLMVMACFLRH
jgi:hypothetical protein